MSSRRSLLLSIAALFAFLGIINASYLAYTSFMGIAPTCTLFDGCDLVAASPYSRVFGVPLSVFGIFFYTATLGFAAWGLASRVARVAQFLLPLTTLGFLLSLYFLYLQAVVIQAYCQYCLFSLFDATVLFALALVVYRDERRKASTLVVE